MLSVDTPQGVCRFGLARADITPPVGIYHRMWGAATHERATGVHRPLTATAVVCQAADDPVTPDREQIILAVDHCLLWGREMEALLQHVAERTGRAREQIVVAFSHTHAAGLLDLSRTHLPGGELIAPYLDQLAGTCAELVRQVRQRVEPVTITCGTGRCALAAHRDLWDADSGQFVCGYHPHGLADDTVLVARVTGGDGRPRATLVNYACHPTTLAWQNTLISPDFPGAMRELVEQATGAPCVFLQGASGDLGPREGFVGEVAVADRNGRQLGYAVLATLEALPPPGTRFRYAGPVVSGATLGPWHHEPLPGGPGRGWRLRRWTVNLPYRQELPLPERMRQQRADWRAEEERALAAGDAARARDCRAQVERADRWLVRLETLPPGPTFPLPVTLGQIGDVFWMAVEGEHYQYLQRTLRERLPGVPILVLTLANGWRCTYLPTADVYGTGVYPETVAVLAAGSLERLTEEIEAEIRRWRDRAT